jgi:hypothetical protein
MTDNHARPPEKINRDFVKPQKRVSPAQRKRDFEADEAEFHRAEQQRLKAEMYARRERAA